MPINPPLVLGWLEVMKTGGPYIVILVLLGFLYLAVKEIKVKEEAIKDLNKLIYSTNNLRLVDQKMITNTLLADAKESTKATTELTGAVNNLARRFHSSGIPPPKESS